MSLAERVSSKFHIWNVYFSDNLSAAGFILRYTSRRKGFIYFIILWLIVFYISNMLGEKEKQKQEVVARANDANKRIDWLIFFIETVIWPGLDGLSRQMNTRNAPWIKTRKSSAFSFYFNYRHHFLKLLIKQFLMDK